MVVTIAPMIAIAALMPMPTAVESQEVSLVLICGKKLLVSTNSPHEEVRTSYSLC